MIVLINKDRTYFQYNSGDSVYIISPFDKSVVYDIKKGNDKICRICHSV